MKEVDAKAQELSNTKADQDILRKDNATIARDLAAWEDQIENGNGPDYYSYDSLTENVLTSPDAHPEIKLFPEQLGPSPGGGEPDTPPAQIGGPVFDQMTGTLLVYAILAALVARDRTGTGQQVEVSLLGSGIHLQAYNLNTALLRGRQIPRPSRRSLKNPMANHFECADGEWLLLSEPQADRFWPAFCDALGIKHLEKDEKYSNAAARRENFRELLDIIEGVFITKTREEWMKILDEKGEGIAYSPVLKPTDLANDAQALENGYITEVDHPSLGPIKVVGNPVNFSEMPVTVDGYSPCFGQNTEEVLLEVCGYDWDRIQQLKDEEVI